MGLGGLGSVSLARARELATEARAVVADGKNPIEARKRDREIPTFGEVADQLIASLEHEWRNAKHRDQWKTSLEGDAKSLRDKPVDQVRTEDVLKVLQPIWTTKPETASRVRGRIERVLDAAKALGYRSGENPALWRGHLQTLLPRRQKLAKSHLLAMPYADVPAFVARLRERPAIAARALEFTILTAARTGETLGASWGEIDLRARVWTVPAQRMKAGKEHRVPLSACALEILQEVAAIRESEGPAAYIFRGLRRDRPLSSMAMAMLLRRMIISNATVHGFRSAFRDWTGERSTFPREVAEAALAHQIGDEVEVERAYRRGDALEKRRKLMDAWAGFCAAPGKIVQMERRA
jgi:integrase